MSTSSSSGQLSATDSLIRRLEQLEVAVPRVEETKADLQVEYGFLQILVELATKAVYTYCFEGEISLDSFRSWVGIHWTRNKTLKVLSVRKVAQFGFVTEFASQQDRDAALAVEIATIRSCTAVHFSWAPECENVTFKLTETPYWLQLTGIPSWLRTSVPAIFNSVAPVLRILQATKDLLAPTVGALLLWDPSVAQPKQVTVDLAWPNRRKSRLAFPATFKVAEESLKASEHKTQNGNSEAIFSLHTWDDMPTLHRNRKQQVENRDQDSTGDSQEVSARVAAATLGANRHEHTQANFTEPAAEAVLQAERQNGTIEDTASAEHHQFSTGQATSSQLEQSAAFLQEHMSVDLPIQLTFPHSARKKLVSRRKRDSTPTRLLPVVRPAAEPLSETDRPSKKIRGFGIGQGQDIDPKFIWRSFTINGETLDIAGIHGPNEAVQRIDFWNTVRNTLPDLPFLFMGDFNNVEVNADSSSRVNHMSAEEFTAFFQLLHHLNTFDTRTIATVKIGPRWTRRETRNGVFTWARLDRIYSAFELFLADSITSVHHVAYQRSDHIPVSVLVQGAEPQGELEELAKTEELLQVNHERIVILSEQIAQLEAWRDFRWRTWSKERFLELGDTNSPYLLRKFRARNQKNLISVLNNDDGTRVTDETGIVRRVYSYYSNIFSAPDPVMSPTAPSDFLRVFQGRLTPQHALFMDSLPSHGEFTDVMLSSAKGKAPGIDGFNVDALQVVWDFVGPVYSTAMQYYWLNGTFPLGFMERVITLVPKGTAPEVITSWRPIIC
ncbi:hypothetical protein R1sor_020816 [Riccia sorocarpa]|uniref:Endonuclease/exonuclease/phosphatase domain-containing protein n=1 Tax=Riccia sorocarpa TaxID=122646 RepID=A0ABD3GIM2_9MARC